VDGVSEESICSSHDGTNIEIVLPILNRYMETVASQVKIGNNRFHAPVSILINNVPGITRG
jgi:hypothetical protein